MKQKIRYIIVALLSVLLPVLMGFLAAGHDKNGMTDQTIMGLWESRKIESSREASRAAESLRQRSLEESISREVAESLSAEESVRESVRHSLWVRDSVEQSLAASLAYEQSVAASIAYEQSLAARLAYEQSVAAALEAFLAESEEEERLRLEAESVAQSWVEESRAEAARQASIAASIEEEERRAAEARAAEASRAAAAAAAAEASRAAASRAAAEASQAAAAAAAAEASRAAASQAAAEASQAAAAAAASRAAAGGSDELTVFIGDSRTSGLGIYGAWPMEYIFYTYTPVRESDGLTEKAAALHPARVIFTNGVDDLISYPASTAASRYESYIWHFHALSPSTQICVCAAIPVQESALSVRPQLASVGEFNGLMQAICRRNGWIYMDASQGLSDACYASDGIHFTPSWTRQWMSNMRSILGF